MSDEQPTVETSGNVSEAGDGVLLEVQIAASPANVWRALTAGIGEWWPNEFFIGGEEGRRSYHLEAQPGGRVYEEWDDGGGLLWGQVCTVIPESMLQAVGYTFPAWGGPSTSFLTWQLTADGDATRLRFEERFLGVSTAANQREKEKGWRFLYEGVMKAHLEGRPAPAWKG